MSGSERDRWVVESVESALNKEGGYVTCSAIDGTVIDTNGTMAVADRVVAATPANDLDDCTTTKVWLRGDSEPLIMDCTIREFLISYFTAMDQ